MEELISDFMIVNFGKPGPKKTPKHILLSKPLRENLDSTQ